MPSKIRQLGDFAKQADDILTRIDNIDSSAISIIAQGTGFDSSSLLSSVDSNYISTRQNLSFGLLSGKPTTLSGYGITNAKTSTEQDSDITSSINTLKDGVISQLDDLNKIAAAINDDSDFFNTIKTYTLANAPLSVIQGNNYGYSYGGYNFPVGIGPWGPGSNPVAGIAFTYTDRFAFSSDGNITDYHNHIGGPRAGSGSVAASNSSTHYYLSGGYTYPQDTNPHEPATGRWSQITKTALSTPISASNIGDLVEQLSSLGSHQSNTHGYTTGGQSEVPSPINSNKIQKFSFSSDGDAVVSGNLTGELRTHGGHSTPHCGYTSGGYGHTNNDVIERFPFAADTNSTDVGDLGVQRTNFAASSSDTHGYLSGGYSSPITPPPIGGNTDAIQKFPFAVSSATSTDVGDQTVGQIGAGSAGNSTTHGYTKGWTGYAQSEPGSGMPATYQKVSFASDANSVNVDSLRPGHLGAGWQS